MRLQDLVTATQQRRERDAEAYANLDHDECMLCGAYGADKRSTTIACGYAVPEVVPEALDVTGVDRFKDAGWGPYYILLCKACRASMLGHLAEWRAGRVARRGLPMDHDGNDDEWSDDANIPIRENGTTRMITRAEWDARQPATPSPALGTQS